MPQSKRAIAWVGVFAALMALIILPGAVAASEHAAGAPAPRKTVDALRRCMDGGGRMLVQALVDESGSLKANDPSGYRADALDVFVWNLAKSVADSGGRGVELQLTAFSTGVLEVQRWTPVTQETLPGLLRAARSFARRDSGLDTDFATALAGARERLDARAAALAREGEETCRVLLWFTDGDYDLEPRRRTVAYAPDLPLHIPGNRERAMEMGRASICGPGGIARALRDTGTTVFAVGLGAFIGPENERFLQAIAEGGDGCGEGNPEAPGDYVSAADLGDLIIKLSSVPRGSTADPDVVTACPGEPCDSGTITFELDSSLRGFNLLISAPEQVQVRLQGPRGGMVDLEAKQAEARGVDGAVVDWRRLRTTRMVDAELDAKSPDWVGTWRVVFIAPAAQAEDLLARTSVVLFGALVPRIVVIEPPRQGEGAMIQVDVVDQAGTPRTPEEIIATLRTRLLVEDHVSGEVVEVPLSLPDEQGRRRGRFAVPEATRATSLRARAFLHVRTVGGLDLPVRETVLDMALEPPADYPSIEPAVLEFGPTVSDERAPGVLRVVGGRAAGCVWFGEPDMPAGRDVGPVRMQVAGGHSDKENCLKVQAGETREIRLSAWHEAATGGTVNGSLPVFLSSVESDRVLERQMPTRVQFLPPPVCDVCRLWRFLMFLLGGVLTPLAGLYVWNVLTARFRDPTSVSCALVNVVVEGDVLQRVAADGPTRFEIGPKDFRPLDVPLGNLAQVSVSGGLEMRRRVPFWRPFRSPEGRAWATGAPAVGSAGSARSRSGEILARIALALPSQWVFVQDVAEPGPGESAPRRSGRLWIFVHENSRVSAIRDEMETRLRREVPVLAATLPVPETDVAPKDVPSSGGGWQPPPAHRVPAYRSPFGGSAAGPSPAGEHPYEDPIGGWLPPSN